MVDRTYVVSETRKVNLFHEGNHWLIRLTKIDGDASTWVMLDESQFI